MLVIKLSHIGCVCFHELHEDAAETPGLMHEEWLDVVHIKHTIMSINLDNQINLHHARSIGPINTGTNKACMLSTQEVRHKCTLRGIT